VVLYANKSAHAFLDGITAGVIGLIGATALGILSETVVGIHTWIIFSIGLIVLFQSKARWTVAAVVLGAGIYGMLIL